MSTTYQAIYIKNDENKIYMHIEEYGENNYVVQTSNDDNCISYNYILDENNTNKIFQNGKDAFEYIVNKYFTQPIKHLETTGTYIVSENELKSISMVDVVNQRSI